MTQMQQAQRNLCRKLGLHNDVPEPIEAALHEFIGMFNGPLPLDVSDALNEMFNLNDDGAEARQLFGGGGLNFSPRPIGYLDTN